MAVAIAWKPAASGLDERRGGDGERIASPRLCARATRRRCASRRSPPRQTPPCGRRARADRRRARRCDRSGSRSLAYSVQALVLRSCTYGRTASPSVQHGHVPPPGCGPPARAPRERSAPLPVERERRIEERDARRRPRPAARSQRGQRAAHPLGRQLLRSQPARNGGRGSSNPRASRWPRRWRRPRLRSPPDEAEIEVRRRPIELRPARSVWNTLAQRSSAAAC